MTGHDIPIDIITGFLGSGKTTLLRHILDNGLDGRRVAIVMNEIGDVGVDGRVIEGLNVEQMIELGSGCVCCTINRAFGLALQELVETVEPELVIVETTGVAEPANIVYETRQAGFAVDATITVVDALNFARELELAEVVRQQVEEADFVVLNKIDAVDAAQADAVERAIREINARAHVTRTSRGVVDADVLFGTASRAHRERAASPDRPQAGHLDRDRITSFVHEVPGALDRERFERFLASLPDAIYRAKGLVRFTESEWTALFNVVCGRFEIEWRDKADADFRSEAVFIGAGATTLRGDISDALNACLA